MSFLYRKIYADLVTPEGDVLVLYLTWLRAWGLRQDRAAVELYRRDGTRTILAVRGCPAAPVPDVLGAAWELDLETAAGLAHLCFADGAPGWTPPGSSAHPSLDWRVLTMRCAAVASGPGLAAPLAGLGYVDQVEMRVPPRALGLDRLVWGRAHGSCDATVFVQTTSRAGLTWSRAATWCQNEGLADTNPAEAAALTAAPGRVLHGGPALDAARFPGLWSRALARWMAGPIDERRTVAVTAGRRALYEHVTFGRHA